MLPIPTSQMTQADLAQELRNALMSPFPIRGWVIDYQVDRYDENTHVFPVYSAPPRRVRVTRAVIDGAVEFYLSPARVYINARWQLTPEVQVLGQRLQIPPEAVEKQLITIHCPQLNVTIDLQAKLITNSYRLDAIIPASQDFLEKVEHYAKLWLNSGKTDQVSYAILGQLGRYRDNSHRSMRQALVKMAATVQSQEPDYWSIVEYVMRGTMTAEAAHRASNAIITVTPMRAAENAARLQ